MAEIKEVESIPPGKFYTVNDLVKLFHYDPRHLRRRIHTGKISAIRLKSGRKLLIHESEVSKVTTKKEEPKKETAIEPKSPPAPKKEESRPSRGDRWLERFGGGKNA